jgi:hypothetical protein
MIGEFLVATFGNSFPFGTMILKIGPPSTVWLPLTGTDHERAAKAVLAENRNGLRQMRWMGIQDKMSPTSPQAGHAC